MKKPIIDVGVKLTDVKDIFGNIHHKATIVHVGENTITINDSETGERWIVSNLDIGRKLKNKPNSHGGHFDVKSCQEKWQKEKNKENLKVRIASAMNGNRQF